MAARKAVPARQAEKPRSPALQKPGKINRPGPAPKRTKYLRAVKIYQRLDAAYPDAKCALDHQNPLQLLIATILSAQSTDKMVNQITPALFKRCKTARDFASIETPELEVMIHSSGFFRNKAKSIKAASRIIAEEHGGQVPSTMEDLLKLPGVARKTANVVLGVAFGKAEGVVVDTHVQRLSRRLDLSKEERPDKIEQDLMQLYPREQWIQLAHLLIHHGRAKCIAIRPKCAECPVEDLCYSKDKTV
ncbi:MAG TPA: endonuclease III [Terriglobia bacterium]|nr:endonuclease III [Terriglobia bacterium]